MAHSSFYDYIQFLMRERAMTLSRLSAESGLSRQTIYQLKQIPETMPRVDTLCKLGHSLGVHPFDLFKRVLSEYTLDHPCNEPASDREDRSVFIDDVTIPDGMQVKPRQPFEKIWRIQNVGDTAWVGRTLVCVDDDSNFVVLREGQPMQLQLLPQQREVLISDTAPGQVVDISVRFVSPQIVGRFVSYWKMRSADGSWSFPNNTGLTVQVQVVDFIHTACHQA